MERPENRENPTGGERSVSWWSSTANRILRVYGRLDQYGVTRVHDRIDCLDKISKHSLAGAKCTDFTDHILGAVPDRESPSFRALSTVRALLQAKEPLIEARQSCCRTILESRREIYTSDGDWDRLGRVRGIGDRESE